MLVLLVAAGLCFAGVFQHDLWTPDEPREAEIGREMLVSQFSAVPTLDAEPFLEKPPLFSWIMAASYAVFGINAGAARLPAALFSVGTMWIAYRMGRRAAGRLAGLCTALVLGTMWQFSVTSHRASLDTALAFFVAAGHLTFLALLTTRNAWSYLALAIFSGLAFLTKSWIGVVLLCAPPMLASVALGDLARVRRVLPAAIAASALGVAAFGLPWVMAVVHAPDGGWAAVREGLGIQYFGRVVGGHRFAKYGHGQPPWYYALSAVLTAPWILTLPAILKGRTLVRGWRHGRVLWCGSIFLAGILLLSIPSGKRGLYLVPLLPAAAVVPGVWMSRIGSRRGGAWDSATLSVLLVFGGLVIAALIVGLGWIGSDLPMSPRLAPLRHAVRGAGGGAIARSVWAASAAGLFALFLRWRHIGRSATALATLVLAFLLVNLLARPMLNPLVELATGARNTAALVPDSEPLLAFFADETLLSAVPFYTGRFIANTENPDEALRALTAGPARHLLVQDRALKRFSPELEARLKLTKSVRFSTKRDIEVYEMKR